MTDLLMWCNVSVHKFRGVNKTEVYEWLKLRAKTNDKWDEFTWMKENMSFFCCVSDSSFHSYQLRNTYNKVEETCSILFYDWSDIDLTLSLNLFNVTVYVFLLSMLLLCVFRPNAFNWDQVVRLSPAERLDHAFTVAKDQLAIERLLDPEGITRCKRKSTSQLPFFSCPQKISLGCGMTYIFRIQNSHIIKHSLSTRSPPSCSASACINSLKSKYLGVVFGWWFVRSCVCTECFGSPCCTCRCSVCCLYSDASCYVMTEEQSHLTCVKAIFNHYNLPHLASFPPLSPSFPSHLLLSSLTATSLHLPCCFSPHVIFTSLSPTLSLSPLCFSCLNCIHFIHCLKDVAVQLPDKKSIIMYVTSLFAVLPKDVSMEAIREVETLPRKYKVEAEDSGPGLSAQVKCQTHCVTVVHSCCMIQDGMKVFDFRTR